MFNFTFSLYLPITTYSISYNERLDSAADIAITDMLGRNIVAPICHDLVENDPSLYSLQHSQCRVGAQSLGKRMHSLGANVVGSETGRGGWEGVRTARALCLYSKLSLNQFFMKFSISLHVLIFFRIKKSYVI